MQLVKSATNETRWILNQMCPGRADLMNKSPSDRMGAVANYFAQQIKVWSLKLLTKSLFKTGVGAIVRMFWILDQKIGLRYFRFNPILK